MTASRQLSCRWIGPLSDSEGFAEEGRSLVAALRQSGVDVTEHDIPHPRVFDNASLMRSTPIALAGDIDEPCVYHRYWSALPAASIAVQIWRTMFETGGIPREWVELGRYYDYLWVPSEFNRKSYASCGVPVEKLIVVPCPLPTWATQLTELLSRRSAGPHSKFVFVSVMRWHWRKGWDVLVRAFIKEFSSEPNVQLVIKARPFDPRYPEQPFHELAQFLADNGLHWPSNLALVTKELSTQQLVQLYRGADAFVLASRGEGWGRPLMEAMLSGLATIGPRWGGNLSFMSDDNSVLIDGELGRVAPQAAKEWPYFDGQYRFEPHVESLQSAMRTVANGTGRSRHKSALVAHSLLEDYSLARVGALMSAELRRIS